MIPTYKHIKFLAIDTDKSSLGDDKSIDSLDSNTEFLDLGGKNINELLTTEKFKYDPALQWLKVAPNQPEGYGGLYLSDIPNYPPSACRQIGRLCLFLYCHELIEKLTNMIKEATRGLSVGTEINIHIFTDIAGGTGAGTFLDVCYLVQYVLGTMGLQGIAQTCGYFFMPDVNLAIVKDDKTRQFIKGNGFASMQELDYCMNFDLNGGEWNQIYGGDISIKTTKPLLSWHI